MFHSFQNHQLSHAQPNSEQEEPNDLPPSENTNDMQDPEMQLLDESNNEVNYFGSDHIRQYVAK